MIREPSLLALLDDPSATGKEQDGRFQLATMFLSILEEAHTQWHIERSMPDNDRGAWVATADVLLSRRYLPLYWRGAQSAYEPSFQRFVDERLHQFGQRPP